MNLKTVKLASAKYYDNLPTSGNELGHAFRDIELEKEVLRAAQESGIGAQFGGKYFAHDVRIIRLPRHGASCPVGLGVSCSADRNIKAKITREGLWVERLDDNPGELIPDELRQAGEGNAVRIDLNRPMNEVLAELSKYPVATRLSLNGTIIVGRDIAHAKIKDASMPARRCRLTSKSIPSTTPVRPRLPREWLRVRSVPRQPAVWTPMSTSSRAMAVR